MFKRGDLILEGIADVDDGKSRALRPEQASLDYFDLWSWDGTLNRVHEVLYVECRERASREASPTAAIIDSQSVKSAEKGGPTIRLDTMQARRSKARNVTSSSIRKAC